MQAGSATSVTMKVIFASVHLLLMFELATKGLSCPPGQFECADGKKCISGRKFCDGKAHCKDGSDEIQMYLWDKEDPSDGILCRSMRVKDRVCFLASGQDMNICNKACGKHEFSCNDGLRCIPKHMFCDDVINCRDGSDESDVGDMECRGWMNLSKTCFVSKEGNNQNICNKKSTCRRGYYKCEDGTQCINAHEFCDRNRHCRDGSDEIKFDSQPLSAGISCRSWWDFSKYCLLPSKFQQDEKMLCNIESTCREDTFRCTKGDQCVPASTVCHGASEWTTAMTIYSITNGTQKRCNGDDVFKCKDNSACVFVFDFCDGVKQCSDGSDEILYNSSIHTLKHGVQCRSWKNLNAVCLYPEVYDSTIPAAFCNTERKCKHGQYICLDGSRCLESHLFCDGKNDCRDGSDEIIFDVKKHEPSDGIRCTGYTNSPKVCLLPKKNEKYRNYFCSDTRCDDDNFMCHSGTECVYYERYCDSKADCSDGSDEIPYNEATASDGVACGSWADLTKKCLLARTEVAPATFGYNNKSTICNNDKLCGKFSFKCATGDQCITTLNFCNGKVDCKDGSDEINYNPEIHKPEDGIACNGWDISQHVCLLRPGYTIDEYICRGKPCTDNQFECADKSRCIRKDKICDGNNDCFTDQSDEILYNSSIHTEQDGVPCRAWDDPEIICLLQASQAHRKNVVCNND